MEILNSLGVNYTLWIQLACFLISYVALTSLVLKPYAAALRERENRTFGNDQAALKIVGETAGLQSTYEKQAREINAEIKTHYDRARKEASKAYEQKMAEAYAESARLLTSARENIKSEIQKAQTQLAGEIPAISAVIASKLAGKEIAP